MVVGGRELIDTLWNVNILLGYLHRLQLHELIDTLWNVNRMTLLQLKRIRQRINRYIMECKFICASIIKRIRNELIDTLWNVNVKRCKYTYDCCEN